YLYTLSLHDALPISIVDYYNRAGAELVDEVANGARFFGVERSVENRVGAAGQAIVLIPRLDTQALPGNAQLVEPVAKRCGVEPRSEEHTSELQSREK